MARSGGFRKPKAANGNDLALTRRIDELFPTWPFPGLWRMTAMLRGEGRLVNRKRARHLMRESAALSSTAFSLFASETSRVLNGSSIYRMSRR
ncbi:IS3 family transposase [Nguyenibacter vanlangensis]|uniref:Transposase n=1 Tax=Nguyenibacter vanlangensis TaxID=1216886 RepID=A0A7Y7M6Q6_9PROT|nr:IS3 family transposase [Nguyenibacter vanlangensis]NVN10628.1 transposase [Nguyenibacter vanlangensis]